jgi:hypothetical protein
VLTQRGREDRDSLAGGNVDSVDVDMQAVRAGSWSCDSVRE